MLETRTVSDTVTRRRNECENGGHRWSTYERVDPATVDTTCSANRPLPVVSATTTRSVRPKEVTTTTCSVSTLPVALASRSTGGKGGSVSAPISPSDPAPSLNGNPIRARERSYPAAFEAEWAQTAKTGSKDKAESWWVKLGRPAFGAAWKLWEACDEWKKDWYNFPHVCQWLRDGRWKQDPTEARVKPTPTADLRCHFHRASGTLGKRPPAGWFASCPECKHARAGGGTRTGEPTTIDDIVAATTAKLAREKGVVLATREELEQLRQRS